MLGFLFTNRSFSGSAYRTFCSLFIARLQLHPVVKVRAVS
jgi:hypothetical protein